MELTVGAIIFIVVVWSLVLGLAIATLRTLTKKPKKEKKTK